jgi:hypothetical protein
MKESVGTAYSESRKVCILAHTDTLPLECATFPADLNSNCYVRFRCGCLANILQYLLVFFFFFMKLYVRFN